VSWRRGAHPHGGTDRVLAALSGLPVVADLRCDVAARTVGAQREWDGATEKETRWCTAAIDRTTARMAMEGIVCGLGRLWLRVAEARDCGRAREKDLVRRGMVGGLES
jgi:hypothetical protein